MCDAAANYTSAALSRMQSTAAALAHPISGAGTAACAARRPAVLSASGELQQRLYAGCCPAPNAQTNAAEWSRRHCCQAVQLRLSSLPSQLLSSPSSRRLHILTDGRDVPDGSSLKFVEELEGVLKELAVSLPCCRRCRRGCSCGGRGAHAFEDLAHHRSCCCRRCRPNTESSACSNALGYSAELFVILCSAGAGL